MDSLMFNFFGGLGLYNLSDSRGYMKTYETTEGELIVNNISDNNHDVSLSIKMAYDAGLLTIDVVNKMTRLLALIKGRKLKGKDLDVSQIRAFLDEIHYATHKPSTKVFSLMQSFHNGVLDLPNLAKELYQLAKLREYSGITTEFRGLVMKGQYTSMFSKLGQGSGSNSSATAAPAQSEATAAPTITPNATVTQSKSDDVSKQIKIVPTAQGQTDEFMEAIFYAKDQKQFEDIFKAYGIKEDEFDIKKLDAWLKEAITTKSPPSGLTNSPSSNGLQ